MSPDTLAPATPAQAPRPAPRAMSLDRVERG